MGHARLDSLLTTLTELEGSDLHVKVGSPPRVRVNGELQRIPSEGEVEPEETLAMVEAIMRPDHFAHFEGSADADFAYSLAGVGRFRVNVFRQRGSVAMIFRLVRNSAASFEDLGLPDAVGKLARNHRGLVLVTGPTGSGKTTTLAAMIDHINATRECHIITIEDPIEVTHSDRQASINQREIGVDADSLHPPHHRRHRDRQPHRRLLPSPPAEPSAGGPGRLHQGDRVPTPGQDHRRGGTRAGARDHDRQRPDPTVHPRPCPHR